MYLIVITYVYEKLHHEQIYKIASYIEGLE